MPYHRFRVRLTTGEWRTSILDSLPVSCGCDGSLEDWIADDLHIAPSDIETVRYLRDTSAIGAVTLKVERNHQSYGGPEEGGWWRDTRETCRTFTVSSRYAARARHWLEKYVNCLNEGLSQFERDGRYYVSRDIRPHLPDFPDSTHYC